MFEMAEHISFSTFRFEQYFFFVTTIVEKPGLHMYKAAN